MNKRKMKKKLQRLERRLSALEALLEAHLARPQIPMPESPYYLLPYLETPTIYCGPSTTKVSSDWSEYSGDWWVMPPEEPSLYGHSVWSNATEVLQ